MPEIQTSFIPKAPMSNTVQSKPAETSIMLMIGLIIFLTVGFSTAGAYVYKTALDLQITDLANQVELIKKDMPPESLAEIEVLNTQLNQADSLLARHVSASSLFNFIQDITIPTVRYTSFTFNGNEVKLKGTARTYEDIAAQSKVFDAHSKEIANFSFGDFDLDQKKNVVFNVTVNVRPNVILYQGTIQTTPLLNTASTSVASSTASSTRRQ